MADDTRNSGETAGGPRRRRPPAPTIELTATEVAADKAAPAAADAGQQRETAETRQDSDVTADTAGETSPGPQAAAASETADAPRAEPEGTPPPGNDGHSTSPPRDIPWRPIAAGAAGGLVVVLLAAAGLWVSLGGRGDGDLADRLARAESQLQGLSRRPAPTAADTRAIDDLAARLARLEQAPGAARTPDPAVSNRLGAVEASAKVVADGLANLNRRADDATAALREMREKVEANARSMSDLSRQASAQAAPIDRADLEALGRRVSALETAAKALKDEIGKAADPERSVRLAVLAVALKSAVERGTSYAAELAAIRPFLAESKVLDPLQAFAATGVPAVAALAQEFSALTPKLLSAANIPEADAGFLNRLQANAERLVRIRPVSEAQGDDPAAVIARMEAKSARGDFAGALADMAKLPPDARALADGWSKKAAARLAAVDAAQRLTADALAGLGRPAIQGGQQK